METEHHESISGTHQLAAVMFTDVVSFSSRMHANEAETLKLVAKDIRRIKDCAERHKGRVLKVMGDGVLIHFQSASEAVRCGLEFQTAMQNGFGPNKEKSPLQHRVGIHLGDMYVSESEVMGDGVNIASRLQTMAEPGGICISQTVYDIIKNKVALNATSLGAQELKNIAQAVNVYKILIGAVDEPAPVAVGTLLKGQQRMAGITGGSTWTDTLAAWWASLLGLWEQQIVRWIACWLLALALLGGVVFGIGWAVTKAGFLQGSQLTLTDAQVRAALVGQEVDLGKVLFVHTSGEIRSGDLLTITPKGVTPLSDGKSYQGEYDFTLRVRGDARAYHASLQYDQIGKILKVEINGPLD